MAALLFCAASRIIFYWTLGIRYLGLRMKQPWRDAALRNYLCTQLMFCSVFTEADPGWVLPSIKKRTPDQGVRYGVSFYRKQTQTRRRTKRKKLKPIISKVDGSGMATMMYPRSSHCPIVVALIKLPGLAQPLISMRFISRPK